MFPDPVLWYTVSLLGGVGVAKFLLGKHRQLINLSDLAVSFGEDFNPTLLGMYVLSGEDCTRAFKGKGRWALKKLEKNPRCHKLFLPNPCARSWVRTIEKLTSKRKVDLARLPPCHPALKPHLQRVNHCIALYKRADESTLEKPNPYDDGQKLDKD